MKDIKLTIEDIKKIFECFEVEGFEIGFGGEKIGEYDLICSSSTSSSDRISYQFEADGKRLSCNDYIYSLFLQRIIEGINIKCENICIDLGCGRVLIKHIVDHKLNVESINHKDFDSIDQAKTQAIEYILDKL